MLSGAIGAYKAVNTVGRYGDAYQSYEASSRVVVKALRNLRIGQTVDHAGESQLIEQLKELEKGKNKNSATSAIDLTTAGVKACVGPLGDVVTDVAAGAAKNCLDGEDLGDGIVYGAVDGVGKGIKKEVRNTALKTAGSWAAHLAGEAAAAAAATWIPVVAAGAGAVGAVVLVVSPEARRAAWEKGAKVAKGAYALATEGAGYTSYNQRILDTYDAVSSKQDEINTLETNKAAKLEEKTRVDALISNLAKQILSGEQEFQKLSNKNLLHRFVFRINRPGKFYHFLNTFFSLLSTRFKDTRQQQITLKSKINENKQSKEKKEQEKTRIEEAINKIAVDILAKKSELESLVEEYINSLKEYPGIHDEENGSTNTE